MDRTTAKELDLEAIREQIEREPATAIETLLRLAVAPPSGGVDTFLDLFATAILKVKATHLVISDPLEQLFGNELSHEQRCFVAACLLRLLAANEALFDEKAFRPKAATLFDDTLRQLYSHLQVDPQEQTYLKIGKLRDVAPKAEQELTNVIGALTDLDAVSKIRQSYMRSLNSVPIRAAVRPFLSDALIARLDDLFGVVDSYRSAQGSEVLEAFQKATTTLQAFLSESATPPGSYSERYLAGLASRLLSLVMTAHAKNPFSKPAALSLTSTEKKYPLHLDGGELEIALVVVNDGPGVALDVFLTVHAAERLELLEQTFPLGTLPAGQLIVPVKARVIQATTRAKVLAEVAWTDSSGEHRKQEAEIDLPSQRSDIDWDSLARTNPYDLNPVETEANLVDRRDVLNQLHALATTSPTGDAYLWGQKRTGKTSIVKSLASTLSSQPNGHIVIYLEGGDYVTKDAETTIDRLGRTLCRRIRQADRRLASVAIPDFKPGFSALNDFLEELRELVPDKRLLIILDEFDELPIDLYKPGPVGDALFLSLRSIGGKPYLGFILVGSEKMEFVFAWQGKHLNKFVQLRIDYFDRAKHWSDFRDLVRVPVEKWLEITDDALLAVYEETAGNPYFTKLICRALFKLACDNHDSHITRREVQASVHDAILAEGSASFQHFWDDGILDPMPRREEISIRRRKVLLAIGECLRRGVPATWQAIALEAKRYGIDESLVQDVLTEFVRRSVLLTENDVYVCKVRFFSRWLQERGITEILTSFSELDALLEERRRHDDAFVRPEEITSVTERWGVYQGRQITEDRVRAWLQQFTDNFSQRLMYKILKGLRFYTQAEVRERLHEAHGIVQRELIDKGLLHVTREAQLKRSHILVSYLDSPGKSGASFAKLYADENRIYVDNVVERGRLASALQSRDDVQALVMLDDFVGTGKQATELLHPFADECGALLQAKGIQTFFIAVSGFAEAKANLTKYTTGGGLPPISVHFCDTLGEADRCFSAVSRIFPEQEEMLKAREVAKEKGTRLEKNAPLGYGDSQAALVFFESCPNNTLPILWSSRSGWLPLFPRL